MTLSLFTYSSMVAYNAGYMQTLNVADAVRNLKEGATKFAKEIGVPFKDVFWREVQDSDWCLLCIIFYASVPKDWEPTSYTIVYDEVHDPIYPNSVMTLNTWMIGVGRRQTIEDIQPDKCHKLFKSKNI
jgi:hypothetical protein